jgi:chromosome segregation ATPase
MQETTASIEHPGLDETPFPDLKRAPGKISFSGDRLRPSVCVDNGHGQHEQGVETADRAPEIPDEWTALLQENEELRQRVAQLEELLDNANRTSMLLHEQQQDHDRMLEEKSEVIRELYQKIQDFQNRPTAETPHEEELLALSEELEHERKQLKDDEDTLMAQMRQMEVQMARERAELARQRNELQQLHNEIRHELVRASRETELRTRMQPFQRRHQEMTPRKGGDTGHASQDATGPAGAGKDSKCKDSGFIRRLFGQ